MRAQDHIVIIGNGIAGTTLARHLRKNSNKKISLISDESPYFFSRTALMYVYMGHMKWKHLQPYEASFWKKNKIELIQKRVRAVETDSNRLIFQDQTCITYDQLVLATGSIPKKFGWPGQELRGVQGLYSKQDLELLEQQAPSNQVCKRAVIVGGGLIGVELAEMLHSRNIPVTFLVREKQFWNTILPEHSASLITNHILNHGIDLKRSTELKSILPSSQNRVKSILTKDQEEEIKCDLVGLTTGVQPNIEFVKPSKIETNTGILIDAYFKTNVSNVYAIGDCAERNYSLGYRPKVESVWYTGRIMGETLAQTLCGNPTTYTPGHWFNSAKFFAIEYQTYGWVFSTPKKGNVHFYWKHENEEKAIEIEYEQSTGKFLGINTFGIRLRHEFFNEVLNKNRTADYVIQHLSKANFDPEFFASYENQIQKKWQQDSNLHTN